jgi:hypothetical protein
MAVVKLKRPARAKGVRHPAKVGEQVPVGTTEQSHRQRFDQLLDDVVFGKPTKR